MHDPRNAIATMEVLTPRKPLWFLREAAIAHFGERAVAVFDLALAETGDIQFASDLALALRLHPFRRAA